MKVEYEGKTYNISTHKHKQFKKRLANKQLTVQQNQEWLESMEQFYQNDAEKFSQSDSTDKTILIVSLVIFVILIVILMTTQALFAIFYFIGIWGMAYVHLKGR